MLIVHWQIQAHKRRDFFSFFQRFLRPEIYGAYESLSYLSQTIFLDYYFVA